VGALLPFCFSQISGGVFAIQKTKGCFSPAGCVPVWFGCKKTHSTLTTLYIRRILILYIYSKFIGSRDKKAK
jgi:hypothetical protein